MTKIDEFSRQLGAQGATLESLEKKFDEHCADDENRHRENIAELRRISDAVRDLTQAIRPVTETVQRITPLVDAQQRTWLQIGGAVATVSGILAFMAYVMSLLGGVILRKLGWQ
jgi:hypothetical protein